MKRWMLVLALVAVLGAACGGGGDTGGEEGGATGDITMVDNAFEPADVTVSAGDTLTIVNTGQAPHTFTVEGEEIDEELDPGAESEVTIDLEAGSYPFVCKLHPEMTGNLTVQ